MLRILCIAEAANPEWVSVPLVGWSLFNALGAVTSAHLVTQVRNAPAIERSGVVGQEDFTPIDSELVARAMWRLSGLLRGGAGKGWTTVTALNSVSYYYFEHLVWKRFGSRIRAGEFDVVHRITPLSPTVPSLIARKCAKAGVPFVVGPLNGGVPWPKAFDAARRKEREWLSYVRGAYRLMPGYGGTRKHAAAIIIGSRDTWAQMPKRYHEKCVYIPENGIDPKRFSLLRTRTAARPIRVVFVGRVVELKGLDLLLESAASLIRAGDIEIKIVGDGPYLDTVRSIVQTEGIASGVEFVGWVDHVQVQQHLAQSDLLALPSIKEFGGGVVLEAMAVGLVPLVIRYGGPAELVTDETALTVDMSGRGEIVRAFREQLERVVASPCIIDEKAKAARERVLSLFTWGAKAQQVLQIYDWALGKCENKPDFGMPLATAKRSDIGGAAYLEGHCDPSRRVRP